MEMQIRNEYWIGLFHWRNEYYSEKDKIVFTKGKPHGRIVIIACDLVVHLEYEGRDGKEHTRIESQKMCKVYMNGLWMRRKEQLWKRNTPQITHPIDMIQEQIIGNFELDQE